jgi:hypothetical protein
MLIVRWLSHAFLFYFRECLEKKMGLADTLRKKVENYENEMQEVKRIALE